MTTHQRFHGKHEDSVELLNEAVERLTVENTKHREELEEIRTLLRFRAGMTTDGLKTVEAVRTVLEERDTATRKFEIIREGVITLRGLLVDGRWKDGLDYIRELLKKPELTVKK